MSRQEKLDAALEKTITVGELHEMLGQYMADNPTTGKDTPVLRFSPRADHVGTPACSPITKSADGLEQEVKWSDQWRMPRIDRDGLAEEWEGKGIAVVLGWSVG